MKILHVYRTYFPDPPGGLQEAIRQISLATGDLGASVKIFTLSPDPEPAVIASAEGDIIRARSLWAPASCDIGGFDAFLKFRHLTKWADLIHFHFPWPFADLLKLVTASCKPKIMTYHSDIVRQKYLNMLYFPLMHCTLSGMAAVVATSPAYCKTSAVLQKHVDPKLLHMIPLGIGDHSLLPIDSVLESNFTSNWQLDREPYILALGVLRYYKGLHTLIAAAKSIRGRIVIAGSGPQEQNLKAQAKQFGVENLVFVGQVSPAEKTALLRGCRGLVLPSHLRSEAFGMVLVEAAMYGKPMISCEIGSGTSFVNQDRETGFVIAPENPVELSLAVNRLLEDPQLAMTMGEAARKRYEKYFSGAALGRAYMDLYQKVLGHNDAVH